MTSATMADQVSAALRAAGGPGARARTGVSRTGGAGSRLAPPRGGGRRGALDGPRHRHRPGERRLGRGAEQVRLDRARGDGGAAVASEPRLGLLEPLEHRLDQLRARAVAQPHDRDLEIDARVRRAAHLGVGVEETAQEQEEIRLPGARLGPERRRAGPSRPGSRPAPGFRSPRPGAPGAGPPSSPRTGAPGRAPPPRHRRSAGAPPAPHAGRARWPGPRPPRRRRCRAAPPPSARRPAPRRTRAPCRGATGHPGDSRRPPGRGAGGHRAPPRRPAPSPPRGSAGAPSLISAPAIGRKSKRWQRERIVAGRRRASVVASTKTTWAGGSSRVFSSALKAGSVSMWTSSMM